MSLSPSVGELVRGLHMPANAFTAERTKLKGMNETNATVTLPAAAADEASVRRKVLEVANLTQVPSAGDDEDGNEGNQAVRLKFAGRTLATRAMVLVTVRLMSTKAEVIINCEKIVVAGILCKELKARLEEEPTSK